MTLANHIPDDTKMVSGVKDSLTTQQEQGEPVAWISWNRVSGESKLNYHKVSSQHDATLWSHFPLYTTPQQRKPLTDEMREQMRFLGFDTLESRTPFVAGWLKAEAAHGIKENT